jgi:hypothetical protein
MSLMASLVTIVVFNFFCIKNTNPIPNQIYFNASNASNICTIQS